VALERAVVNSRKAVLTMAAKHRLVALVLMAGACGLLPTLSGSRSDHPERQLSRWEQRVRQRL